MSEYDDSGSKSNANDSRSESGALYRPELDSGNNTNNDELKEDISGSLNSGLDSSECTLKRPRIQEEQFGATVPPQESYTAAASIDTNQAEQESSPNADLAPGISQTRDSLQISGGDVAQNDDTVGLLITPDGTKWHQLTPGKHSSGRFWERNNGGQDPIRKVININL